MKTGRDKKVAEEIRREVSQIIHFELADPRIAGATVTGVRMTPDLSLARIYFALPGRENQKDEVRAALKKSVPFVRQLVAKRIRIKFMPQIDFFYDDSFEIEKKLKEIFSQLPDSSEEPTHDEEPS